MKEKPFDCVRMKQEIQEQILREQESLSPEEFEEKSKRDIAADSILGPFLQRVRRIEPEEREAS